MMAGTCVWFAGVAKGGRPLGSSTGEAKIGTRLAKSWEKKRGRWWRLCVVFQTFRLGSIKNHGTIYGLPA